MPNFREFWIRIDVSSIPNIFDNEPKHLDTNKHKGTVVHVIEYSALEASQAKVDKLEIENQDLRNESQTEALRAMLDIERAKVKELEQQLSVAVCALKDIEDHWEVNESQEIAKYALKKLNEFKKKGI